MQKIKKEEGPEESASKQGHDLSIIEIEQIKQGLIPDLYNEEKQALEAETKLKIIKDIVEKKIGATSMNSIDLGPPFDRVAIGKESDNKWSKKLIATRILKTKMKRLLQKRRQLRAHLEEEMAPEIRRKIKLGKEQLELLELQAELEAEEILARWEKEQKKKDEEKKKDDKV